MLVLEKFDGAVVRTVGPMTAATCPMLGPTKLRGPGVKCGKPATGKAGRGKARLGGATGVVAALALPTGATMPSVVPRAPRAARRLTVEFISVPLSGRPRWPPSTSF
jgi:hypothetical protein